MPGSSSSTAYPMHRHGCSCTPGGEAAKKCRGRPLSKRSGDPVVRGGVPKTSVALDTVMNSYPRFVENGLEPFNPLELTRATEEICCHGDSRKYTDFYCTGVYGGISTGYLVGCCLRCVFCWVGLSREFPEQYGELHSSQEAFSQLVTNARRAGLNKLRLSGGEPTLGREHLMELLGLANSTHYLFILETNGVLLGADERYVQELKSFPNVHVRVSLKAGTPEGFQRRTGARGEFVELPYRAIEHLRNSKVSFHVAAMTDSRFMELSEKRELVRRLEAIGYNGYLEEEVADPYETSVLRLRKAGLKIF